MQGEYYGQIKPTNLIKDDNSSYYWLITVPILYGKSNENNQKMQFLFDSGVGGSIFLSQAAFDKISKICKRVQEVNVINIFGIDIPFYKARNPKYDKVNILGSNALEVTRSSIVKNHGQAKKFSWILNNNIQVLPKIIYQQTFHPLAEGQTKFRNVIVKVGHNKEQKRTIIFDTGFGFDYGKTPSEYFVKDKQLLNVSESGRIVFGQKYQLLFKLSNSKHFNDDIVGYNKFIGYQIVFSGKSDKQLYWAIADK